MSFIASSRTHVFEDCSGACLPGPPGSTTDRLTFFSVYQLRRKVLELLDRGLKTNNRSAGLCLLSLKRIIENQSALNFVAAFQTPFAYSHLARGDGSESQQLTQALGLVRFLLAAPCMDSLQLVIPPEAFPTTGLYLPHLHALIHAGDGPVAIDADMEQIRFTWLDGEAVTLPAEGLNDEFLPTMQRVELGRRVAGLRLLNGLPELTGQPLDLPPHPLPSAKEISDLEAGFDLLEQVWPEAYHAASRVFSSVVILPQSGPQTRSVTSGDFHGTLITSVHNPFQVGDAICHESSHARLNLFFEIDPLVQDGLAEIHPSPWRPDLRPLNGILNGVHAFVNVCRYYERLAQHSPEIAENAREILSVQKRKLADGWKYLEAHAKPTELGSTFFCELERAVDAINAAPVETHKQKFQSY